MRYAHGMEKRTITRVCDLCEGDVPAVETVTVVWKGGRSVEVDVCENDSQLLHAGRRLTSGRSSTTTDSAAIREWAREHNMEVGDRGRISPEVVAAYNAKK